MKWISVKKEPPPRDKPIIVLSLGKIKTAIYCSDVDRFIPNCECSGWEHEWGKVEITHWMPLPELPNEVV